MKIRKALATGSICICFAMAAYGQSADDVINAYIDAIGGKAAVDSIESIKVTTSMHNNTYSPTTKGYVHYRKKPNFYRLDSIRTTGEESRNAFNASSIISVRIDAEGKAGDAREKSREEEPAWASRETDLYFQMGPFINYAEKGMTAEYLGKETVDGKDMHIVKVVWQKDDYSINYYFDAQTGLLHMNKRGSMTAVYSDYRKAGSVLMPHSIKEFGTMRNGKEFTYEERFDTVEVNSLTDTVFTNIK